MWYQKDNFTLAEILFTANQIERVLVGSTDLREIRNIKSNYIHAMRREAERNVGKQKYEDVEIQTLAIVSEVLKKAI